MGTPESIQISFPDLDINLSAKLLWDLNPELCQLLVDHLPIETIFSHTMSSGQGLYAPIRIVGNVSAKYDLLSEAPLGSVMLSTEVYKTLVMFYGEITEPLPGPRVAQVIDQSIADLKRAGREVWISNYMTHVPVRVIFKSLQTGGE